MTTTPGAWIVGGTAGIGRAVADELLTRGWQVVVSGRSAAELRRTGPSRWEARVDTTSTDDVEATYRRIAGEGIGIDAVVNCAGASVAGSIMDLTDDQWAGAIETKLLGYVRVCRTVLPGLAERQGALVNVIGSAAAVATADYAVGSLAAALVHVTRGVAQEWCPRGVRVFGINPGPTETDRLSALIASRAAEERTTLDDARAGLASSLYRRRPLAPGEIAATVADLLGPGGVALSGSILLADGGASGGWI